MGNIGTGGDEAEFHAGWLAWDNEAGASFAHPPGLNGFRHACDSATSTWRSQRQGSRTSRLYGMKPWMKPPCLRQRKNCITVQNSGNLNKVIRQVSRKGSRVLPGKANSCDAESVLELVSLHSVRVALRRSVCMISGCREVAFKFLDCFGRREVSGEEKLIISLGSR